MSTNPVVPRPAQQTMLPAEVVRDNVSTVLRQRPDLISYDPTTDEGEMIGLICQVAPGVPATQRDGWRGTVCHWGLSAQEVTDKDTGEVSVLPSIYLHPEDGEGVRLYGWPAVKAWAAIVKALGVERCQLGVKVRVKRQPSGTAGRSYWVVLPDA